MLTPFSYKCANESEQEMRDTSSAPNPTPNGELESVCQIDGTWSIDPNDVICPSTVFKLIKYKFENDHLRIVNFFT